MKNDRPSDLSHAPVAMAYVQWLAANDIEDSNANAWRFMAETRVSRRPKRRRAAWVWASVAVIATVAVFTFVYGVATANHWSKVVEPEVTKNISVPDGTWSVSMDVSKPVCYDGQYASACAISLTGEWILACDERVLDSYSQDLCDSYFDTVQTFKEDVAQAPLAMLDSSSDGVGRLSAEANKRYETVVVKEAVREDAVCYYSFLGDCPLSDD
ncbi:hypothetical protein Q9S71_12730 [Microbacterium sp. KSW4-11]|uniref:DUF4189 domain-containing protein n=1 Tax=Microbacterium gawkjiense TaxID=3067309 RepID=A0ABU3GG57_9MICO|nr:hypothetical protein [Microbacterium sp. KSW4-11]MDT3317685.1 hypothetical protein [Microbacterium sp. KSW4-11]